MFAINIENLKTLKFHIYIYIYIYIYIKKISLSIFTASVVMNMKKYFYNMNNQLKYYEFLFN